MSATPVRSQELRVADYAAAIASASPTPGGGSVAAMVCSFAASLVEMVCAITLNGSKPPADPQALTEATEAAARLRQRLLDLASEDEAAYGGYRAAVALPKSTEEEINARREALQQALCVSADVPILIAEAGLQVLAQLKVAGRLGTKHALSDIATGAYLAEAAIHSSLLNVEVNAGSMHDDVRASAYRARSAEIANSARSATADVLAIVHGRK